jgi:MoaA/NifB/PqqE/SkfB family radical SAM enzyme|tara:strand:+ start:4233 stop:5318 length:1086 start_codon:yes stop_codon:yes gene_type:complete
MYRYEDIREVHLEVTQKCQAACPMCDRNMNGGDDNPHLTNAEITLQKAKKIFKPDFIKQLKTMYMCGNLGDPIVARDTLEIFKYFREHNPTMWLSMNTNAGARDMPWWMELAQVFGRNGAVIFSVDGLEDTNHLYRQNVQWDKVETNMKAFIAAGGRARWDYIIFQHNEHQVEEAEALANDWGVEKFIKKKTGRFYSTKKMTGKETHQAINRKGQKTQTLAKPKEKQFANKELDKQKNIAKQYGSMMEYYNQCKINCKVKDAGNIFITAEGLLMPCCWTAGRMYKWWHADPKVEQIWTHIDEAGGKGGINVVMNDLKKVMEGPLLKSIEDSWSAKTVKEGKLGVCSEKCGAKFDPFAAQFS